MREVMLAYFAGEKQAALALLAAGTLALAAAALLLLPRWGLRSLVVTLGVFALVLLAIGVGLYLRTGPQVDQLQQQLASAAASFFSEETARMQRVQRNFVVIELAELGVIIVSAALAIGLKERPGVVGVALGLLINATFLLCFDLVAERRGAVYLEQLLSQR